MVEDPFAALEKSLQSVFHMVAIRNGKYTYTPIQNLHEAISEYKLKPQDKHSFIELLSALEAALPFLAARWHLDYKTIRMSMDKLAERHHMPTIDWKDVQSHLQVSQLSLFSTKNRAEEDKLLPWLNTKTGHTFDRLNHIDATKKLIELRKEDGFTQKLGVHLKEDPEFLVRLIMKSEKNFIKIAKTRLILYLTDAQLASAIIKHTPKLIDRHKDPIIETERYIDKLNEILSKGRSVGIILKSAEAKTILDNDKHFQLYQSDDYKNRSDTRNVPMRRG